jgi:macrolide transport system ATP-binding/permease protein
VSRPAIFARIRNTCQALRHRGRWEGELEAELRSHVEHRAADLVRTGLPPESAERQARVELGAREAYKEQCRGAHGLRWPDELRQDLHYAVRILRHSPGFTAVALLSLALGIGVNTTVFSVINALLLRPLAVASPGDLYFVQTNQFPTNSFPNYRDLRDRNSTFSALAAYRQAPMGLAAGGGAQRIWGYLATGNYFDTLGIRPALGRFFHAEDDRQPGASPFVVLSHACWHDRFGADPRIAGKTVRINSLPYTVLGVAPPGFHGTELFFWPEVWVPMAMQPQIEGRSWLEERGTSNALVVGRLRRGVTPRRAEEDLNAIIADLARDFPIWNQGLKLTLAQPGLVGDALRNPARAFTGGVMALAALVLLTACANLASLLSARAADRDRELAIRLSIGAGRARIARQLVAESLLLSLAGGAVGCGLAAAVLRLLSRWHAPLDFPVRFEVGADGRVFAFALTVAMLTGLLFSIAPLRQVARADVNHALKGLPSATSRVRRWAARDLLLAVQVVLCCVLVTASFVALRGLARSLATPLGFEPRGVAVAGFELGLAGYGEEDGRTFQRRALAAAAGLPGVSAAAYADSVPLSIDQSTTVVFRQDAVDFRAAEAKKAAYYQVSPGYFQAMGTRLLAGRDFTWHDDRTAPPVAVVNAVFARQVIGTSAAVGSRFRRGRNRPLVEIIGVVEDGKYVSLTEAARPALFLPIVQSYNSETMLIVRSQIPASEMALQLRGTVARLDPRLPVHGTGSLAQMLGFAFFPARAATLALGVFGLLAIMLAATGIYGLAAYSVSRRVREIGIRVAVGARPRQVLRFVLGRTILLLAVGSVVGLALGLAASRVLASVVYLASPRDPFVLPATAFTMVLIGLGAALPPARRALDIDPVRALRQE